MARIDQTIGLAMYGMYGHQVHQHALNNPRVRIVGIGGAEQEKWVDDIRRDETIRRYRDLDELLADQDVDLVSLCPDHRFKQVDDALACLKAGKHVYAEKPCAFDEQTLDELLQVAKAQGVVFREMNDTLYVPPFQAFRHRILNGEIGQVVQVVAQKSYPLGDHRPIDDQTDGGLIQQVGVHAVRMVEQVAVQRISDDTDAIRVDEAWLNYQGQSERNTGAIAAAATIQMRLASGGIATVICNYLRPGQFPTWGNEMVRAFGTKGMLETVDAGTRTRLVTDKVDQVIDEPIDASSGGTPIPFEALLDELLGSPPTQQDPSGQPIVLPAVEDELHATRVVIRALKLARSKQTPKPIV